MSAIVQHTGSGLAEVLQVAQALRQAGGMLPRHFQRDGEIVAVILAGQELGFGPMASLRSIHLVNGKVGLSYDAMIGLLRRAKYKISWKAKTDKIAHLELTHPDGTTHEEKWDVSRATKAGLWGKSGPWSQYPDTMLAARCVSSAARAFAGDVLAGCYTPDEMEEIGGGATVTVTEPDPHSYDNPEHDEAAQTAVAIANGFVAKHLADLEERARLVADEAASLDDPDDANALTKATAYQIREWAKEHAAEWRETFAHPKARQKAGKLSLRMRHWAKAAGLSEAFPKDAMVDALRQTGLEEVEGEAAQ